VTDDIWTQFARLHAATVYEANGKLGGMSHRIRPLFPGLRLAGPAFTVKCWPSDGSAFMRAIDEAASGDVLVIDSGADEMSTVWGGGSTIAAAKRGIRGMVTNGAVRDVHVIREVGFAVFSAGVCLHGGTKNHRGWTQIPIAVGGVPVHPGDLVLGDDDGVVVVAEDHLAEVLAKAETRAAHEDATEERLRAGESYSKMTGVA
jgi:4-hydroxy-4-methyl-2-oxoglutarate aldolase